MFVFDSINKLYLENQYIIDFLSRPIIYLNKNEVKKDKNIFYKDSNELDFLILFERILKLYHKPEKTKIAQNLIFFKTVYKRIKINVMKIIIIYFLIFILN